MYEGQKKFGKVSCLAAGCDTHQWEVSHSHSICTADFAQSLFWCEKKKAFLSDLPPLVLTYQLFAFIFLVFLYGRMRCIGSPQTNMCCPWEVLLPWVLSKILPRTSRKTDHSVKGSKTYSFFFPSAFVIQRCSCIMSGLCVYMPLKVERCLWIVEVYVQVCLFFMSPRQSHWYSGPIKSISAAKWPAFLQVNSLLVCESRPFRHRISSVYTYHWNKKKSCFSNYFPLHTYSWPDCSWVLSLLCEFILFGGGWKSPQRNRDPLF